MQIGNITIPDHIRIDCEFGKRVTTDFENKIHWLPINLDNVNISRPTILCFGGIGTTNSRDANYVAKMVQRIIPVEGEANLVSIIHSHNQGENYARYFDEDPNELFSYGYSEATHIVDALFLPFVCDKDGNRLMVQEACKNVRNLTIFAHCYGHFSSVRYIEESFRDSLAIMSYTPDEIERILKQVFVLSYEAGDIYQTSFSNVNISSIASELWENVVLAMPERDLNFVTMEGDEKERIMSSEMYKTTDPELVRKFLRNNKYAIMREGNTIDIFTNALTTDHSDHDLETIYRHIDGRFSSYTNELGTIVSDTISVALKLALQNSVKNRMSKKFIPLDMDEIFKQCCQSLKLARTFFGEVAELNFE